MGVVTNIANAEYKYQSQAFKASAIADFDIADNVLVFTKNFVPNVGISGDTTQIVLTFFLPKSTPEAITSLSVTDVLPAGLTFVSGTVVVDGTPDGSADPSNGISIGTLNPGQTIVVTFNATVD